MFVGPSTHPSAWSAPDLCYATPLAVLDLRDWSAMRTQTMQMSAPCRSAAVPTPQGMLDYFPKRPITKAQAVQQQTSCLIIVL